MKTSIDDARLGRPPGMLEQPMPTAAKHPDNAASEAVPGTFPENPCAPRPRPRGSERER